MIRGKRGMRRWPATPRRRLKAQEIVSKQLWKEASGPAEDFPQRPDKIVQLVELTEKID